MKYYIVYFCCNLHKAKHENVSILMEFGTLSVMCITRTKALKPFMNLYFILRLVNILFQTLLNLLITYYTVCVYTTLFIVTKQTNKQTKISAYLVLQV